MNLEEHFNHKEIKEITSFNESDLILRSKRRYNIIQKLININEFGDEYLQCKCSKGTTQELLTCNHYRNCFCFGSDYEEMHPLFKQKITTLLQ